ncbi:MAG: hypothetical protein Hals2KO_39860 [Halioglobus sp.]
MSDTQRDKITASDVSGIKQFYDEVYHVGAEAASVGPSRHDFRLTKKLGIRNGESVLDVACGTGGWLEACKERGASVAGIDLSTRAIAVCRQRIPEGEFHDQPAETLPFSDGEFDVVTCLGSLEHFLNPVASLREMVRVAKPDARFCILVPNSDFLTRKLGLFKGTYQVTAKEVVRSLEEWDTLFTQAGLCVDRRWRDLHVLNLNWITRGSPIMWPVRALQALVLPLWPLRWQYQVYHVCRAEPSAFVH